MLPDEAAEVAKVLGELAACVAGVLTGAAEVVRSACAVLLPETDRAVPPRTAMRSQKSRNCWNAGWIFEKPDVEALCFELMQVRQNPNDSWKADPGRQMLGVLPVC